VTDHDRAAMRASSSRPTREPHFFAFLRAFLREGTQPQYAFFVGRRRLVVFFEVFFEVFFAAFFAVFFFAM
jgi:hypothetical protein